MHGYEEIGLYEQVLGDNLESAEVENVDLEHARR